jgi:hypothetical protein
MGKHPLENKIEERTVMCDVIVVAETLADLATEGSTRHPTCPPDRLAARE